MNNNQDLISKTELEQLIIDNIKELQETKLQGTVGDVRIIMTRVGGQAKILKEIFEITEEDLK